MTASKPSQRLLSEQRQRLVTDLRVRGISDETTLAAIGTIPRERFVLPGWEHRAYEDSAMPIGRQQTISQPYTVAYMTEALKIKRGEKVLEIGTGSGYQAAVLSWLGAKVYSVERQEELYNNARKLFFELKYTIHTRLGDGTIGWKEHAPYDAIIVTAGAPDIPNALVAQLQVGGRMAIPVGDEQKQTLHLVNRIDAEHYEAYTLDDFRFVPLIGKEGWASRTAHGDIVVDR